MLSSVLHAPLRFFESTPQGRLVVLLPSYSYLCRAIDFRIMNLFSRDQYVVDEVLVRVMSGFFRSTFLRFLQY